MGWTGRSNGRQIYRNSSGTVGTPRGLEEGVRMYILETDVSLIE
jgi:hypothetical protein